MMTKDDTDLAETASRKTRSSIWWAECWVTALLVVILWQVIEIRRSLPSNTASQAEPTQGFTDRISGFILSLPSHLPVVIAMGLVSLVFLAAVVSTLVAFVRWLVANRKPITDSWLIEERKVTLVKCAWGLAVAWVAVPLVLVVGWLLYG